MEDAELTHTGAGTPMGELMRRFWQPVCLSSEITDLPHAIRILGEDLYQTAMSKTHRSL